MSDASWNVNIMPMLLTSRWSQSMFHLLTYLQFFYTEHKRFLCIPCVSVYAYELTRLSNALFNSIRKHSLLQDGNPMTNMWWWSSNHWHLSCVLKSLNKILTNNFHGCQPKLVNIHQLIDIGPLGSKTEIFLFVAYIWHNIFHSNCYLQYLVNMALLMEISNTGGYYYLWAHKLLD